MGGADPAAKLGVDLLGAELVAWMRAKWPVGSLSSEVPSKVQVVLPSGTGATALFLAAYLQRPHHELGLAMPVEVLTVPVAGNRVTLLDSMRRLLPGQSEAMLPTYVRVLVQCRARLSDMAPLGSSTRSSAIASLSLTSTSRSSTACSGELSSASPLLLLLLFRPPLPSSYSSPTNPSLSSFLSNPSLLPLPSLLLRSRERVSSCRVGACVACSGADVDALVRRRKGLEVDLIYATKTWKALFEHWHRLTVRPHLLSGTCMPSILLTVVCLC